MTIGQWKIGNSSSEFEMATVTVWKLLSMHFWQDGCVHHIPTEVGEDWSSPTYSKEIALVFEIRDGDSRRLGFRWMYVLNMTVAFFIKYATFLSNLVDIGRIVRKNQQFFEIQDGRSHHLGFSGVRAFDKTNAFYIEFTVYPSGSHHKGFCWMYVWHDNCVPFLIRYIPAKFGED